MKLYKDSLLIVSGIVYMSGDEHGEGVLMMFDKDDISTIQDNDRYYQTSSYFYYPTQMDVSDSHDVLIAVSPKNGIYNDVFYSGVGFRTEIKKLRLDPTSKTMT